MRRLFGKFLNFKVTNNSFLGKEPVIKRVKFQPEVIESLDLVSVLDFVPLFNFLYKFESFSFHVLDIQNSGPIGNSIVLSITNFESFLLLLHVFQLYLAQVEYFISRLRVNRLRVLQELVKQLWCSFHVVKIRCMLRLFPVQSFKSLFLCYTKEMMNWLTQSVIGIFYSFYKL